MADVFDLGYQFKRGFKGPIESDGVFATVADAKAFLSSVRTCYPGQTFSITGETDTTLNGFYYTPTGYNKTNAKLEKVGGESKSYWEGDEASAKHEVHHWRGQRSSYEFLANNSQLDPWTRYSVIEADGTVTEYYGTNIISNHTGQLLPVNSIVETVAESEKTPGARYLVGLDGQGYSIYEYTLDTANNIVEKVTAFDDKYGVRVKDKGLKNYVYVNNTLRTYDDVDCGTF